MTSQNTLGFDKSADKKVSDDPAIEAMRGLAALMVVATHYSFMLSPQPGLFGFASTGVDLFFVLSGYVFAPYVFGKSLSLLPHLIRRLFRLYPLYLSALLLYVALRVPTDSAWEYFGIHIFMGHTLNSRSIASFYNPAFWSLPPEVEFYLILPLLAWIGARKSFGQFRFVWLVLLATFMHFALVAAGLPDEEEFSARAISTIHLPGLLIEFLLGSMAFAISRQDSHYLCPRIRLVFGFLILTGMAFIFAEYVMAVNGVPKIVPIWIGGNIGLGAALGYALIVSSVVTPLTGYKSHHRKFLSSNNFLWLKKGALSVCLIAGHLSYGIYLLHNAAPQILRRVTPETTGWPALLACLFITLMMAFVAHHSIEKPMREYGRKLSQAMMRSK